MLNFLSPNVVASHNNINQPNRCIIMWRKPNLSASSLLFDENGLCLYFLKVIILEMPNKFYNEFFIRI